jgi:Subtilase family
MKIRTWLPAVLLVLLWAAPAQADNRIIVRTTLGLAGLQQLCNLPLLGNCTVVGPLDGTLNQVFLITTPLDGTIFLGLLRPLTGIVDAELDQLISLLGGLNSATSPPAALTDSTPVTYYNATVWNGYANQPAAQIVRVAAAQSQFQVAGSGIIADIDTGVDPNHPAFTGVMLAGYDFTRNQPGASELNDLSPTDFPSPPPPCPPSQCPPGLVNQSSMAILDQSSMAILDTKPQYAAFGHGTMVMGILHLVAPKASLLPLKAFHSDGTGYLSDVLRALYYAAQNGANIVNMSFDFATSSPELSSALDYVNQAALICAASAGNDGQNETVYPAALQSVVMGVASTNDSDMRSSFSNFGNQIVWVAAPGEGIVTTYPFSTYAAGWGTSFSTPFVSSASALLVNKQGKTNESQAAAALAHAVPVGPDMGNGRLDIVQALQAVSPADYSISPNPTSATISAGQPATYTLTLAPINGFNQAVSLTCNGFPPASTCLIAPSTVTLDGTNSATVTVTVQTSARAALALASLSGAGALPPTAVLLVGFLACWVVWQLVTPALGRRGRSPRRRPGFAAALGLLVASLCWNSCGGNHSGTTVSPSSSTLSLISLNPTSVNGGSPSTGEVTLSGPAPSGGTVISLLSNNTSVATVPASVTVAAGSAVATFQVTTQAVPNTTTVNITASQTGVTQQPTASLMVTPLPAPGPTLTSLTLNPGSVTGGSPSTGSVALSAPAPSGGAVVSLSSSDRALAALPAAVTIAAGATGASFAVTTSAVTASRAVSISATYAGVTQTGSLMVTAAPAPGTPAGTYTLTITGTAGNLSHNASVRLVVN